MSKVNKGYKVFISYKYADSSVLQMPLWCDHTTGITTARHYVDIIQEEFEHLEHINKGENDGEDLSQFKDETIASKLRAKIYDSRVTIVLISPQMRDMTKKEADQWIPWEIRYSLREPSRNGRTSHRNAILGVVLPDKNNNYTYAITTKECFGCRCCQYPLVDSFAVLKQLVFNREYPDLKKDCIQKQSTYLFPHSYMHIVTWDEFLSNINKCLDTAVGISETKYTWKMPNLNS